jgi:hypothetical protein
LVLLEKREPLLEAVITALNHDTAVEVDLREAWAVAAEAFAYSPELIL